MNYGLGLGVLAGDSVRFRADVMFQGYLIHLYDLEFDTLDTTISLNLGGNRLFVFAGIEI